MEAKRYLTGVELQPVALTPGEGEEIRGFELRLRWVDITTREPTLGEPVFVDEVSLLSLLDELRRRIDQANAERAPLH